MAQVKKVKTAIIGCGTICKRIYAPNLANKFHIIDLVACADRIPERAAALAERAFVRRVNGGCSSPMAAHAVLRGELLELTALYYDEDRGSYRKHTMTGERSCAEEIGVEMGDWFRDNKGDGV